jgi:hypothetical protein
VEAEAKPSSHELIKRSMSMTALGSSNGRYPKTKHMVAGTSENVLEKAEAKSWWQFWR